MEIKALTLILLSLFSPLLMAQTTLVLGTIQRIPISTPERTGMADLIAKEAFRRIGIKLRIDDIPAKRALANANEGIHDGDLARVAGVGNRYHNLLPVPEITWVAEIGGFSKDPKMMTPSWQSLVNYDLAYIRGWVIFERNIKHSRSLTRVVDPESLFSFLDKGRADIVLYEKKMGLGVIAKMGLKGIHVVKPVLSKEPIYIYLHKKHKALLPKLAAAIRAMKQDGSYQKIQYDALKEVLSEQQIADFFATQKEFE